LTSWFRFRRTVENTPTVLVALEQEASARTCASLVLRLGLSELQWSVAAEGGAVRKTSSLDAHRANACLFSIETPALLRGLRIHAEVERSRMWPGKMNSMATSFLTLAELNH
ncbi:MAG: hypothetical protein ACRD2Q_05295, partial [Terriglobales bacterium]